ncbi:MAG: SPOR domain-containing protein [candidate division Zixibacteria bacterium]|nr:SPOR domain-containing protein [candidate division Zixibacteria bacterium]
MRRRKLLIYFLLCLCFSGCALRPREPIKKDARTRGEKQFDPLGFPQDRMIVTEDELGEKREGATEPEKQNKIGWEESKGIENLLPRKVYRVQFFATKYPDEASQVAESVANQLSQKTYIDYKTPYYWVRLGECQTKEEADSLLRKIKELGYKESWVVEVEIQP